MTKADGPDPYRDRRWPNWRCGALAAILAAALAACCPAPLGEDGAPTAFAASVTEVDGAGFWVEASDGTRWRLTGVPPVQAGGRVYVEGAFTAAGGFRAERTTRIDAN